MKYLIIANGNFLTREIIEELSAKELVTVIALDGAADQLKQLNIMPHIILGDFDSINYSYWQEQAKNNPELQLLSRKDQSLTDLEKAIQYCDEYHASEIDIICVIGDRMDHSLTNIFSLRKFYSPQRSIKIYTETQILEFAKNKKVIIQGKIGAYCGIMAFPEAIVTTHGLKYELTETKLLFATNDSIANQLEKNLASVDIQGEALIIHPGNLSAQNDVI